MAEDEDVSFGVPGDPKVPVVPPDVIYHNGVRPGLLHQPRLWTQVPSTSTARAAYRPVKSAGPATLLTTSEPGGGASSRSSLAQRQRDRMSSIFADEHVPGRQPGRMVALGLALRLVQLLEVTFGSPWDATLCRATAAGYDSCGRQPAPRNKKARWQL